MRTGIFGHLPTGTDVIARLTDRLRAARDAGFDSVWASQMFGADTLTAFAVAGRDVPEVTLGTAVVPTFARHPMVMAQQAMTVNEAIGGRLRLGIGLSHQVVVEGMWGLSFARPARHLQEYLEALVPLLHGEAVNVTGELITTRGQLAIGGPPPSVLVAALGERMLRITGRLADGTVTWMTGPVTLAEHVVPTITEAAAAAGRPAPEVVAGVPICVTDDPATARDVAAKLFAMYGQLPSYRAMLDREGAAGPEDVALVGDEDTVRAGIERYRQAGVTELIASEFGSAQERERTLSLVASLP